MKINRGFWVAVGAAIVAAVLVGVAAWEIGRSALRATTRLKPGGETLLLRQEFVRDDLELGFGQRLDLDKLLNDQADEYEKMQPTFTGAGIAQRKAKNEEFYREIAQRIDAILDDKQQVRFQEIRLQARGSGALTDEAIVSALSITPDQSARIAALLAKKQSLVLAMVYHGGPRLTPEQSLKEIKAAYSYGDKALEVLAPEQRAAFEKMQGKRVNWPIDPQKPGDLEKSFGLDRVKS